MASDESLMRAAIRKASDGISDGQLPFGACVAKDSEIVSCAYNTLLREVNTTAHAEINAIKEACGALKTIDLTGCTLFCTCEPCPMCLGACGLANISKIVYGARIRDVDLEGFTVLETPAEIIGLIGEGKIEVTGDFLREENLELFRSWEHRNGRSR
jgi:guanine deaminase